MTNRANNANQTPAPVIIARGEVYRWNTSLTQVDDFGDNASGRYQLTISVDKETADRLYEVDANVIEETCPDSGETLYTLKPRTLYGQGHDKGFKVINAKKKPMDLMEDLPEEFALTSTRKELGAGSQVAVKVAIVPNKRKKTAANQTLLYMLQVIKAVPPKSGGGSVDSGFDSYDYDEDDDGFSDY